MWDGKPRKEVYIAIDGTRFSSITMKNFYEKNLKEKEEKEDSKESSS